MDINEVAIIFLLIGTIIGLVVGHRIGVSTGESNEAMRQRKREWENK